MELPLRSMPFFIASIFSSPHQSRKDGDSFIILFLHSDRIHFFLFRLYRSHMDQVREISLCPSFSHLHSKFII